MIPEAWFPHRRPDGEIVGFIAEAGDEFQPYDLLGRPHGGMCDWGTAEERLDRLNLAWLGEPQMMTVRAGEPPRRVRVQEVDRGRIVVIDDAYGAAQGVPPPGMSLETWSFELPLQVELRPL